VTELAQSRLWHVSEESDIKIFTPRSPPARAVGVHTPVVWAVNTARLPNYLVPRDCPRVTFYRSATTTLADALRFDLPVDKQVIVIESRWHERFARAKLWLYELPVNGFRCLDENAGYWVNDTEVSPLTNRKIEDLSRELALHGAVLRISDCLRTMAGEVTASSLGFSVIRLQNAL